MVDSLPEDGLTDAGDGCWYHGVTGSADRRDTHLSSFVSSTSQSFFRGIPFKRLAEILDVCGCIADVNMPSLAHVPDVKRLGKY